jgi:hypothetical protein
MVAEYAEMMLFTLLFVYFCVSVSGMSWFLSLMDAVLTAVPSQSTVIAVQHASIQLSFQTCSSCLQTVDVISCRARAA